MSETEHTPLTAEDLAEIRERQEYAGSYIQLAASERHVSDEAIACICEDVPRLLAEVQRLRGALTPLVEKPSTMWTDQGVYVCAYCDEFEVGNRQTDYRHTHAETCPWVVAKKALGIDPEQ